MLDDVLLDAISYVQNLVTEMFGEVWFDDIRFHDVTNAYDVRYPSGL